MIVGDQLLEVCGINMRSAKKITASTVLSQCGKSVTMLVQNNTDKYRESQEWQGSSSGSSLLEELQPSREGTPTPRNSPPPPPTSQIYQPTPLPTSRQSTLTRPQISQVLSALNREDETVDTAVSTAHHIRDSSNCSSRGSSSLRSKSGRSSKRSNNSSG